MVRPSGVQVGLSEGGIELSQALVGQTEFAIADEHPHGDTRRADARLATHHAWCFADHSFGRRHSSPPRSSYHTTPVLPCPNRAARLQSSASLEDRRCRSRSPFTTNTPTGSARCSRNSNAATFRSCASTRGRTVTTRPRSHLRTGSCSTG